MQKLSKIIWEWDKEIVETRLKFFYLLFSESSRSKMDLRAWAPMLRGSVCDLTSSRLRSMPLPKDSSPAISAFLTHTISLLYTSDIERVFTACPWVWVLKYCTCVLLPKWTQRSSILWFNQPFYVVLIERGVTWISHRFRWHRRRHFLCKLQNIYTFSLGRKSSLFFLSFVP